MRTTIRQIGNSKGIIIPASFLSESGLKNEIEMTLKGRSIVIEPVQKAPRQGWFEGYQPASDVDAWDGFIAMEHEEDDWEW